MSPTRETCKRCGRENPLGFTVPDKVWSKAVPPEFREHVLCILCFDELATQAGVDWASGRVRFWPISGIQALQNGLSAYGITPSEAVKRWGDTLFRIPSRLWHWWAGFCIEYLNRCPHCLRIVDRITDKAGLCWADCPRHGWVG